MDRTENTVSNSSILASAVVAAGTRLPSGYLETSRGGTHRQPDDRSHKPFIFIFQIDARRLKGNNDGNKYPAQKCDPNIKTVVLVGYNPGQKRLGTTRYL
jgi:hypothetical protein